MIDLIIPIFIISIIIYGRVKKVDPYASFITGCKTSFKMVLYMFPYLIAMFIAISLFRVSGLSLYLCDFLSPIFTFLGVPAELTEFVIIRPFSGSASLVTLKEIYSLYGVDSYIGRCASVIIGGSDTVFYICSVYFSGTSIKKTLLALPISLICNIFSAVLACWLCTIM